MAGVLANAKEEAGLNFSRSAQIAKQNKSIMDLRPSKALASGLKRVGGRSGISRLGRANRENLNNARKGRPVIMHKF